MTLLPLLLFVLAAAAADSPAALKPARVMNKGVHDEAFTLLATPTESSINLWSLATGRQMGHVDLPTFERKHEKDAIAITVHSIRADLGLVMATVKHWFYNPSYDVNDRNSEYWRKAEHATYLAPLDGAAPIKLWSGEGGCGSYGLQTYCPGAFTDYGRTLILADRPEATIHGIVSVSGNQDKNFNRSWIVLAFDLTGRKVYESRDGEKTYPPSEKIGDGIATDEQSCRVLRGGKTAAYLEECKKSDYPSLTKDGKTATSTYDGASGYKVWDAETGRRLIAFKAKNPEKWVLNSIWTEVPGGSSPATLSIRPAPMSCRSGTRARRSSSPSAWAPSSRISTTSVPAATACSSTGARMGRMTR
ncbi:MAG: hypothetical protein M0D55_19950 [Elusimicrobiota bacterium]|nr:MAG: hypothetical protein M0D55_19950 [Elusimicrobiota bacterium]